MRVLKNVIILVCLAMFLSAAGCSRNESNEALMEESESLRERVAEEEDRPESQTESDDIVEEETVWVLATRRNYQGDCLNWTEVYEHDSNGNIVSITRYDSEGSIQWTDDMEYDGNNNNTHYSHFEAETGETTVTDRTYDSYGNCISESRYSIYLNRNTSDTSVTLYSHEYDNSGNMIRSATQDASGNEVRYTEFVYDTAGNLLSETYYVLTNGTSWTVSDRREYEYDDYGNAIFEYNCDSDGNRTEFDEFEYDDSYNLVRVIHHYGDLVYVQKVYVYDEMGNIIEEIEFNEDDSVDTHRWITYDSYGNMTLSTTETNNTEYSTTYEYVSIEN